MHCIGECNSYDECHTIVFLTSQSNDNCFLCNKNFELNELVKSNISNLYNKECKYKLLSINSLLGATLSYMLKNYQKRFTIKNLIKLFDFETIVDNNVTLYYAVDYDANNIIRFNENWEYLLL
jgi:hypothetical protein